MACFSSGRVHFSGHPWHVTVSPDAGMGLARACEVRNVFLFDESPSSRLCTRACLRYLFYIGQIKAVYLQCAAAGWLCWRGQGVRWSERPGAQGAQGALGAQGAQGGRWTGGGRARSLGGRRARGRRVRGRRPRGGGWSRLPPAGCLPPLPPRSSPLPNAPPRSARSAAGSWRTERRPIASPCRRGIRTRTRS